MEERKYVCKYCRKRFPCGKSLGGHIRTHMTEERSNNIINNNHNNINNNNVVNDDGGDEENINISMLVKLEGVRNKNKRDLWCEQQEDEDVVADDVVVPHNNNIYGLRENPKKTMRFVHFGGSGAKNEQQQQQQQQHHQQEERFCRECGKGFPSLKALCGHMACHSEKEKRTTRFEEESGVGVHDKKLKLVMDSHSDTETCCAAPPRRSKRMKVKTINNLSSNNHHYPFSSSTSCAAAPLADNGSSPVSEVEQEQQEEVAMCLMLLSRDSSGGGFNKGRFASAVAESSGNNSVILEANKSSSPDTLIGFINANNYNNNSVSKHHLAHNLVEKKLLKVKDIKLKKSAEFGARYGSKTKMLVDSGVSNNGGEFKSSKHSNTASVVRKLVVEDLEYDRRTDGTTATTTTRRFDSRKRSNNNNNNNYDHSNSLGGHNLGGGGVSSSKKMENAFVGTKGCKKYHDECLEGGERDNACSYAYDSLDVMSDENSSDTESFPSPRSQKVKSINGKKKSSNTSTSKAKKLKLNKASSKKSKEHECPICYKVFKSGQALGGHKRSHFIGGSEENTTVVIKQVVAPCFIDLNLPAPVDE